MLDSTTWKTASAESTTALSSMMETRVSALSFLIGGEVTMQRRLVEVALFPNDVGKVLDLLFNQDGFVFRLLVSANNSELLRKKEGFYPWSS